MTNEIHVRDIPAKQLNAYLAQMVAEDPEFVYYGVTLPFGYDAEADRVRALGQVRVFKQQRPVKIFTVDKQLHKLVRIKSKRKR